MAIDRCTVFNRLAIEILNITGMLSNRRLSAAIADASWAELARQLTYKQQWRGGHLTPIDRWYPSTKTCAPCRTVASTMPLHQRTFVCAACGHQADPGVASFKPGQDRTVLSHVRV